MDRQPSQFGRLLSEWMAAEDLTQRQLAGDIGWSESLVSMVRSGDRQPTPEAMAGAIARAPQPWKGRLYQARKTDQDAADAAAVAAVVA